MKTGYFSHLISVFVARNPALERRKKGKGGRKEGGREGVRRGKEKPRKQRSKDLRKE